MTTAEQLYGHTTVQASAGSGKTYLLISRIVRLLLTGAEAGNILAITFTRKAANEMQTRLLERLFELATCEENSLEQIISDLQLEATAETRQLARSLYENILRSETPVKTLTFHSFCQELLRRFPMEAEISPGFDLVDKTALLYDEAWDALMAEANRHNHDDLANSLKLLFDELGLYNVKQALRSFLEHRSDWWAYTYNETSPVQFATARLKQQLKIENDNNPVEEFINDPQTITLLNEFHVLLCKHNNKTNQQHSELIYQVIDDTHQPGHRFNLFKDCFLTKTGELRKRKESATQEKSMGAEGQQRFLELHHLLGNKIIAVNALLAAIRTYHTSSAWYLAGSCFLEYYQKIKNEQRCLDFNDLEWKTYLLLNQSNNALWVQYKLDQRIDHLLVDEFQDTNPTQWRLLLPLLEEMAASDDERNRSVFLVGDAKQSIYRFRRAEPRLFNAAQNWLSVNLNASTCPLSHSWRSSPAIISFVNKIFTQPGVSNLLPDFPEHSTHRQQLAGKVTLLPMSLKERAETVEEENLAPASLRNPLQQPREEIISQHSFNEGMQIAEKINELIASKLAIESKQGKSAINYNDIIILFRSRTQIKHYERALRESGIPYIGADRGTLLESLEVNDLLDLLQWLILPFDNLSLAGILRSPLFDVSNEDLIAIKQSGKGNWLERLEKYVQHNPQHPVLPRAYQLLTQWQIDASKLPVHDLLDKIYSEANVLSRYVEAFPAHLGQRVVANLNRFLELALEMDSGRYPSLTRFSSWLNEIRQVENEAPDEPVTPATDESDQRVQLLSVHAAKGLEAPVIFLADSASTPANNKANSTLIDWPAENDKPGYFMLRAKKDDLDNFSQHCINEQELFEKRENANLLYVALTRAKQYLYISASEPKNRDNGWYQIICSAFDIKTTENSSEVVLISEGEDEIATVETIINDNNIISIDEKLRTPIKVPVQEVDISPSQLTSHSEYNPDAAEENTLRGTIMHQMLNILSVTPGKSFSQFHSMEMKSIDTAETEAWWNECRDVIQHPEFSDYFEAERFDKSYNEVAIQFKENGKMVYGIIDRLVVKGNNATIIDYKTHPYVNESNIDEIAKRYQQQMQLYQKGIQLLWPGYTITPTIIFTAINKQVCL